MNLEEQYKKETGEEARPGYQNYAGGNYHYDLYSKEYVKWLEKKANPVENQVSQAASQAVPEPNVLCEQNMFGYWDKMKNRISMVYGNIKQVEVCSPDFFKGATERGEGQIVKLKVIASKL